VKCVQCGAETAEVAQFCVRCGAPPVGQPRVATYPADGGPGDSAAIAAGKDAGSRPGRARRRYFRLFLACCVILCCVIVNDVLLALYAPSVWNNTSNSALVNWIGGTIAVIGLVSLCGAVIFLVAFVHARSPEWARDGPSGRVTICKGVYADDHGLTVRNWPFRVRRFDWAEVSNFGDGSRMVDPTSPYGRDRRVWTLDIVLRTGQRVSVLSGRLTPETLAAVRQVAARYGIPAHLTGVAAPEPLAWVVPKRRGRIKD
jgi:membrane-bound metal-dependent hydrolase YbcI (DUF457 family)